MQRIIIVSVLISVFSMNAGDAPKKRSPLSFLACSANNKRRQSINTEPATDAVQLKEIFELVDSIPLFYDSSEEDPIKKVLRVVCGDDHQESSDDKLVSVQEKDKAALYKDALENGTPAARRRNSVLGEKKVAITPS